MNQFLLALAPLLAANSKDAVAEPRIEVWAGHQVSNGKRKIPLYGEKETHTENYFIAEVNRTSSRIDIRQKTCRIDIRPIKGVTPTMKPESIARLPKAHIVLEEKADGSLVAVPWSTGWESEDVDADGFPGATVQISGTSCSGDIYVSSQSVTSLLSGCATDDGATGEVSLRLRQKILGAKGLCLKLMAGDSDETQTGWLAYRRVEPGTTCQSLAGKPWPVKAGPPEAARTQSR
ncbi:MAG TPA: hypothetical protein VF524_06665 [Polyangia bacterium]